MSVWHTFWLAVASIAYTGGAWLYTLRILENERYEELRDSCYRRWGRAATWAGIIVVVALWPLSEAVRALRERS